jgi:hypothetical protein
VQPFIIGIAVALGTFVLTRAAGFDRDKALYPTILIVVAHYYVLFAAIGASRGVLIEETLVMGLFAAAAVLGFRKNLWLAAIALAAHGLFDLTHARFITNPGVPEWWPMFCLGFDVMIAACLAWLLKRPVDAER